MGKELNAPYYETSAFTRFGVNEVFENVIRSALISRRHQRFWMTNLKHVRHCLLQEPFCPPKPPFPQLKVPPSTYQQDVRSLLSRQAYTDVLFVNNTSSLNCHKIHCNRLVLVAVSDNFHTLFTYHQYNQAKAHHSSSMAAFNGQPLTKYASDMSIASSADEFDRQKHKLFNDDSLLDLRMSRHLKNFFSASILFPLLSFDTSKLFKHSFSKHNKLFSCGKTSHSKHRFKLLQQKLVTVYLGSEESASLKSKSQSVISFGPNIPFEALKSWILMAYSMSWSSVEKDSISIDHLARCLQVFDFVDFDSFTPDDSPLHDVLSCKLKRYIDEIKCDLFAKRFVFFGIEKGLFSGKVAPECLFAVHFLYHFFQFVDVTFKLDDGTVYGHKRYLFQFHF